MAIKFIKPAEKKEEPIESLETDVKPVQCNEDSTTDIQYINSPPVHRYQPTENLNNAETLFSLVEGPLASQLAMNGVIVSTSTLKENGFKVTVSPIQGEHCHICAPRGSGVLRRWMCVSLIHNDISGKLWVCSNCSAVYEHKRGGHDLWRELQIARR
ncbi:hypothetical protein [Geobacter sulfurreducens]|uniref:hypothetical protein n=1 Tax=Geobacter sulfurreducens TaxID=35554 RepID=UPI00257247DE|nr:hypothetical protein [Geobacter sulfurreducens]